MNKAVFACTLPGGAGRDTLHFIAKLADCQALTATLRNSVSAFVVSGSDSEGYVFTLVTRKGFPMLSLTKALP